MDKFDVLHGGALYDRFPGRWEVGRYPDGTLGDVFAFSAGNRA